MTIFGASVLTACSPAAVKTLAVSLSLPRGGAVVPFLFSTKAVADSGALGLKLEKWWYTLPEAFRFFVSGNLGNLCFYAIERGIYSCIGLIKSPPPILAEHQDSVSFFLGYILQIVTQHLLHAWLVYGLHTINTRDRYFKTLFGQGSAYFVALIGSTALNMYLRKQGFSKNTAFFTTLYLFACINYFVIGWITRTSAGTAEPEKGTTSAYKKKGIPRGGGCKASAIDIQSTGHKLRDMYSPKNSGCFTVRRLILTVNSEPCHFSSDMNSQRLPSDLNSTYR